MALYLFTKAILEGKPIPLFNHGDMLRDFTYIDDVVDGVISLLDKPAAPSDSFDPGCPRADISNAPYRIYNIGNNRPEKLDTVVALLEETLGIRANKEHLPMQPGDVKETYADISALQQATGYTPKTSIDDGVKQFVAWYKKYHDVPGETHQ
jgi:UDP-glucuronate 4-epimerase